MASSEQQKIGKELMALITEIKIQAMKDGRKPPSVREITNRIAKKIKDEDIIFNDIIHFR